MKNKYILSKEQIKREYGTLTEFANHYKLSRQEVSARYTKHGISFNNVIEKGFVRLLDKTQIAQFEQEFLDHLAKLDKANNDIQNFHNEKVGD